VPPPHVEPRPEASPEPAPRLTFEQRTPPPHRPTSVLRSPWFWGVTAAIVVAAAGASWYYLDVPTRDPTRGTLIPGVIAVP
jgi:hypothetical protein